MLERLLEAQGREREKGRTRGKKISTVATISLLWYTPGFDGTIEKK